MIRLTKKMEDGSYESSEGTLFGYDNPSCKQNTDNIIDRCGRLEDFLELLRGRIITSFNYPIKLDIDVISIIHDLESLGLDMKM